MSPGASPGMPWGNRRFQAKEIWPHDHDRQARHAARADGAFRPPPIGSDRIQYMNAVDGTCMPTTSCKAPAWPALDISRGDHIPIHASHCASHWHRRRRQALSCSINDRKADHILWANPGKRHGVVVGARASCCIGSSQRTRLFLSALTETRSRHGGRCRGLVAVRCMPHFRLGGVTCAQAPRESATRGDGESEWEHSR